VDIVGNSAQQKGLPYKFYHGKTGVVFNITKSSVGVLVQKVVGNRYIEKRLHVRIEHVRHSRCREGINYEGRTNSDFLRRVKENAERRRQAKAEGSMGFSFDFTNSSHCEPQETSYSTPRCKTC
jgi:large subunit ribosomal protein L21e